MRARVTDLVGRKIVAVNMGAYKAENGWTCHNPRITLDNGVELWFVAEETEGSEYGVCICKTPTPKGKR